MAADGQEAVNVTSTVQTITLPLSGKTISAKGQALKLACELVEAWSKSTRVTIQTGESKPVSQRDFDAMRASTDSAAPKFAAVA